MKEKSNKNVKNKNRWKLEKKETKPAYQRFNTWHES